MSGSDFNDVHVREGIDALREQLNVVLEAKPAVGVDDVPKDWENMFLRTERGVLKGAMRNVVLILQNRSEFRGMLSWCEFSYKIIFAADPPWSNGGKQGDEWLDAHALRLKDWLGEHYHISPSVQEIHEAVSMVAMDHSFHPVRNYLQGLRWDGIERLDFWLDDILEATGDSEYLKKVSSKFLIGAVARVMMPHGKPAKMDNVLILEGVQGIGKSSLVRVLFNDWSSESTIDFSNKDSFQQIQGVWGVEMPELDSFNKAESTTAKAFFTSSTDRFRPPYGRSVVEYPRQCVFVGTTNQDEYLKDYSGNRRYWPVRATAVHMDILIQSRDQLWAEAYHKFKEGVKWWVLPDETDLFTSEQDSRMLDDPWEWIIAKWLDEVENRLTQSFTSDQIIIGACKKDPGHIQKADAMRVAPILKHMGWTKKRTRVTENGQIKRRWAYFRPPVPKSESINEF